MFFFYKKRKKKNQEFGHQDEEEPIIKGEDGGRARRVLLLPLRSPLGEDEFEELSFFGSLANACFSSSHCLSSIL